MFGLGAIPSMMVIYLRRKIPESPRYTARILGDIEAATQAVKDFKGTNVKAKSVVETRAIKKASLKDFIQNKRYMITLLGTAGSWFLMDYAYYGNTISTPMIMNSISPNMILESKILSSFLIFTVFALPGYILAILLMNKIGRKTIQILGFSVIRTVFLLTGLIPEIERDFTLFFALYGTSYFFTEFGPNTTTFVIPAELFPTQYRTTGHGFSSGIAKFGAFLGVLLFPILNDSIGINRTFFVVSVFFAFLGIVTTLILPESKGKSLENLTQEIAVH